MAAAKSPTSSEAMCQVCFTSDSGNRLCGKCKKVYYCGKECQRQDWSTHKKVCARDYKEGDGVGEGQFKQVNTRFDRDLAVHGGGTKPVTVASKAIKNFIRDQLGDDKVAEAFGFNVAIPLGEHARCVLNVKKLVALKGGSCIIGWSLFENQYLIEAESHALWEPPDHKTLLNVTPLVNAKRELVNYSGTFVRDSNAIDCLAGVMRPNIIFWK
jgi:hypothetical protein